MKTIITDPVCGTEVDESSALRAKYAGCTFLFCCDHCRAAFLRDPGEFTADEDDLDEFGDAGEVPARPTRDQKWADYLPLAVILALTLGAACAKQLSYVDSSWTSWMHDFIGFFLVVFSMFKLLNLEGFTEGFQRYDLVAKRFRSYAFVYPYIELSLGFGFLSHWQPAVVYSVTIVVMSVSWLGAILTLSKWRSEERACLGSASRVPLSTVALLENLGMSAISAAMLAGKVTGLH